MPSNDGSEQEGSTPKINVVLTPEQIELCNAGFFEALLYYTTYPKQLFRDIFTSSKRLYAYIVSSYFNRGDDHEE